MDATAPMKTHALATGLIFQAETSIMMGAIMSPVPRSIRCSFPPGFSGGALAVTVNAMSFLTYELRHLHHMLGGEYGKEIIDREQYEEQEEGQDAHRYPEYGADAGCREYGCLVLDLREEES